MANQLNSLGECDPSSSESIIGQNGAALAQMSAGLAHDFRNILAVIESGISVAQRNFNDPAKVEAALGAAHEGVRRGVLLTSKLVAFAKPGTAVAHPASVNELLEGLKAFLGYAAGPEIRLTLNLAPDLPQCLVDPSQFNAAILNLVINARDAMPDGGDIHIDTDQVLEEIERSEIPSRSSVRVRISDQGCGMSQEIVQRVFDPYFTTKGEAGTGLGIPQAAAFMQSSGGTLCLNTEPPRDCRRP